MHLIIRLKRLGRIRKPFYNIVVTDTRAGRNSMHYDKVGTYNPFANSHRQKQIYLDWARFNHWLAQGAIIHPSLYKLLLL